MRNKGSPRIVSASIVVVLIAASVACFAQITSVPSREPDLTLQSSDISFSPSRPVEQLVTIDVSVHNVGFHTAHDVKVQFFYDTCDKRCVSIGVDTIASIAPGETGIASINWDAEYGIHNIYVEVDSEDRIRELNEDNNKNSTAIFVNAEVEERIILSPEQLEAEFSQHIEPRDLLTYAAELGYSKLLGGARDIYGNGMTIIWGTVSSEERENVLIAANLSLGVTVLVKIERERLYLLRRQQGGHGSCDYWHCVDAGMQAALGPGEAISCAECAVSITTSEFVASFGVTCAGCYWAVGQIIGIVTCCKAYPCTWCTSDACGYTGWTDSPYCHDGDVYQKYEECDCLNAGDLNSECACSSTRTRKEECPYGCKDAQCLPKPKPIKNYGPVNVLYADTGPPEQWTWNIAGTWTFSGLPDSTADGRVYIRFDPLVTNKTNGGSGYNATVQVDYNTWRGYVGLWNIHPEFQEPSNTFGWGYQAYGYKPVSLSNIPATGKLTVHLSEHYHMAINKDCCTLEWRDCPSGSSNAVERIEPGGQNATSPTIRYTASYATTIASVKKHGAVTVLYADTGPPEQWTWNVAGRWTFSGLPDSTADGKLYIRFDPLVTNKADGGSGYYAFVNITYNGRTCRVRLCNIHPEFQEPRDTFGWGYQTYGYVAVPLSDIPATGKLTVHLEVESSEHHDVAVNKGCCTLEWH